MVFKQFEFIRLHELVGGEGSRVGLHFDGSRPLAEQVSVAVLEMHLGLLHVVVHDRHIERSVGTQKPKTVLASNQHCVAAQTGTGSPKPAKHHFVRSVKSVLG